MYVALIACHENPDKALYCLTSVAHCQKMCERYPGLFTLGPPYPKHQLHRNTKHLLIPIRRNALWRDMNAEGHQMVQWPSIVIMEHHEKSTGWEPFKQSAVYTNMTNLGYCRCPQILTFEQFEVFYKALTKETLQNTLKTCKKIRII